MRCVRAVAKRLDYSGQKYPKITLWGEASDAVSLLNLREVKSPILIMKLTAREIEELRKTTPFIDLIIEALLSSEEIEFEIVDERNELRESLTE